MCKPSIIVCFIVTRPDFYGFAVIGYSPVKIPLQCPGDAPVIIGLIVERYDVNGSRKSFNGVIILLGRFDILAIGLFEGLQEVHRVASNQILDLPGVRLVETTVAVDVKKYNNRLAKIVVSKK